jgi:phosphoglycolate phosphatase-like HAD superfamily hydrolase
MTDFSKIKMIIWDMDQTLYPYWEDLTDYCHEATAHCALEMGADLSKQDADNLSRISYQMRGTTTKLFNEQFGLDDVQLFRDSHERMIERLIDPQWGDHMQPNPELVELMRKAKQAGIRQVILTNGAQCWAQHIAELLDIDQFMDVIMGADNFGLRQKGIDGILPFMSVLAKAQYDDAYDHVLVVEDSLKNMIAPKEYGMKTAWVQWGHPEYDGLGQPDYVDMIFDRPNDVLKKIFDDKLKAPGPVSQNRKRPISHRFPKP